MKKSSISLAILSSLLLSACGGGNSNQSPSSAQNSVSNAQTNTSNNQPTANNTSTSNTNTNSSVNPSQTSSLQQWDMFNIEPVFAVNSNKINDVQLLTNKLTHAHGVSYETNHANEETIIYLTQQGEYVNWGPLHSEYGYEIGKVDFNGLKFKISLFSPSQSQGFVKTLDTKEIDLSGESVLVAIEPELNWQINEPIYSHSTLNNTTVEKLKKIQNLKFPAGAKCLQAVYDHYNQEHLVLSISNIDYKKDFERLLDKYNQQQNGADSIKSDPVSKLTQFYGAHTYLDKFDQGFSLFNGKYYKTKKIERGYQYVHADLVQDYIDEANAYKDPVEKSARLKFAESYKKQCDLYNAVAADFIKKNVKL